MKKNLPNLVKILAFVLVMYGIHTLLQPKQVKAPQIISPLAEVTPTVVSSPTPLPTNTGKASWYGGYFHGRRTANGEIFDENGLTLACTNRFKLGTVFRISYQGKSEIARCTDRGGFETLGRTFDLSKGLFEKLAPLSRGVIQVDYEIVNNNDKQRPLDYKKAFESCTRELYKLQRTGGDNL